MDVQALEDIPEYDLMQYFVVYYNKGAFKKLKSGTNRDSPGNNKPIVTLPHAQPPTNYAIVKQLEKLLLPEEGGFGAMNLTEIEFQLIKILKLGA